MFLTITLLFVAFLLFAIVAALALSGHSRLGHARAHGDPRPKYARQAHALPRTHRAERTLQLHEKTEAAEEGGEAEGGIRKCEGRQAESQGRVRTEGGEAEAQGHDDHGEVRFVIRG